MVRSLLFYMSSFVHLFFNLKILRLIDKTMMLIRSFWYSKEFIKIGNNVSFGKSFYLLGSNCITIGDNVSFGRNCVLTAWEKYEREKFTPQIVIDSDCHFGEYNHITSINQIHISSGLLTGRWVTITDNSHGRTDYNSLHIPPVERNLYSKGPVKIGRNVWIGDKVTILPGVTIGDGVVIGANTVVTKDIPAYSVFTGNSLILKNT